MLSTANAHDGQVGLDEKSRHWNSQLPPQILNEEGSQVATWSIGTSSDNGAKNKNLKLRSPPQALRCSESTIHFQSLVRKNTTEET